jgi:hypothetical protein
MLNIKRRKSYLQKTYKIKLKMKLQLDKNLLGTMCKESFLITASVEQ